MTTPGLKPWVLPMKTKFVVKKDKTSWKPESCLWRKAAKLKGRRQWSKTHNIGLHGGKENCLIFPSDPKPKYRQTYYIHLHTGLNKISLSCLNWIEPHRTTRQPMCVFYPAAGWRGLPVQPVCCSSTDRSGSRRARGGRVRSGPTASPWSGAGPLSRGASHKHPCAWTGWCRWPAESW